MPVDWGEFEVENKPSDGTDWSEFTPEKPDSAFKLDPYAQARMSGAVSGPMTPFGPPHPEELLDIPKVPGAIVQGVGKGLVQAVDLPIRGINATLGRVTGVKAPLVEDMPQLQLPKIELTKTEEDLARANPNLFAKALPTTAGLWNTGADLVNQFAPGFSPPETSLMLPLAGGEGAIAKIATLLFGASQLEALPEQLKNAYKVLTDPNAPTSKKIEEISKPVVNAALVALMAKHGLSEKGQPNAEGIREDTGQPKETGQVAEGVKTDRGGDVQQAPPGQPEPVEQGKAQVQDAAKESPRVLLTPELQKQIDAAPPLQPGERYVQVVPKDGSAPYIASYADKFFDFGDLGKFHNVGKVMEGKWSHGMAKPGDRIVEIEGQQSAPTEQREMFKEPTFTPSILTPNERLEGKSHPEIRKDASKKGIDAMEDTPGVVTGFVIRRYKGDKGVFLSRPEAMAEFKKIRPDAKTSHPIALTSEDLVDQKMLGHLDEKSPETAPAPEPPKPPETPPAVPETPAPAPVSIPEKIVSALEAQADAARARYKGREKQFQKTSINPDVFQLGNIKDVAIIAAAKLARFGLDTAKTSAALIKEFGKGIEPHLDRILREATGIYYRHTEVVRKVEQVLSEAGLAAKQITKRGKTAIAGAIEEGAKAGKQLTLAEVQPRIQALQDKLTDSISKADALGEYFKGQEKGGAAGRKAATDELKLADRWLEADANTIREGLTGLVQSLPLAERGRFVKAIANATKRPPLVGGDPGSMYRNAASVAARIVNRVEEVHRDGVVEDIRKTVATSIKSPGVDIGYKGRILDVVKRLAFTGRTPDTINALKRTKAYLSQMAAKGVDVSMPKDVLDSLEVLAKTPVKDLPIGVLEAIRDKVKMLDQLGRLKVKSRKAVWEIEKNKRTRELVNEPTNPVENRPEFKPIPGEKQTLMQKVSNWVTRRLNNAALLDRAILPIDAIMDLLGDAKGRYQGWLFRNIRNPLDLAHNEAQALKDSLTQPLRNIIKEHNLNDQNAERIGVYAHTLQEGGRQRLIDSGLSPETIDRIASSITPEEKAAYNAMRKAMDSTLPEVQKLMHELYNIPVEPVKNYFPMPRDWKQFEADPAAPKEPIFGQPTSYDELGAWKDMMGDYGAPRGAKAERGFTIERQEGAKTPIKVNAFDVFNQHIDDVSHLIKTQRELKMAGELAKGQLFQSKYGKQGQSLILDWLDTFARQGKMSGLRRIGLLDALRRNTSVGVIAFRLASQIVHTANVPLGVARAGPVWYGRGLTETLSPEGQAFLKRNFAETVQRGGGEPAQVEATRGPITKAGFEIARTIDRLNAQATTLGVYMRLLKEKGLDPGQYDKMPVDKQAQAQALVLARRAVASPLPKDVSQSLSRGALTGGNVSLGRTLLQFGNIFQDQWSNIRHDLWRAGIRELNPKQAATMTAALTAMIVIDAGIKSASQQAINAVTGYKPKKEEDFGKRVGVEMLKRIPFMGQGMAMAFYGESGIPILDAAINTAKSAWQSQTAKKETTRQKALIRAVAGAAQLGGAPGAAQIGEVMEKSQ